MPQAQPCLRCGKLTVRSPCDECKRAAGQAQNAGSFYRTAFWRRLARACVQRDGCCAVCGSTHRLTAAHIIARLAGGADTLDNLMTLCGSCHSRYERGADSEHVQLVDAIGRVLLAQRGSNQ